MTTGRINQIAIVGHALHAPRHATPPHARVCVKRITHTHTRREPRTRRAGSHIDNGHTHTRPEGIQACVCGCGVVLKAPRLLQHGQRQAVGPRTVHTRVHLRQTLPPSIHSLRLSTFPLGIRVDKGRHPGGIRICMRPPFGRPAQTHYNSGRHFPSPSPSV